MLRVIVDLSSGSLLRAIPPSTSFLPSLAFPRTLDSPCLSLERPIMSVEVKATFVYLIPRYNYRQTGYRWAPSTAIYRVFEQPRLRGRGRDKKTAGGTKKETIERGGVLRPVARGEDGLSFGEQFSYDEWTE